ncbi:MAG TPA: hypothetical protein VKE69_07855, partial [Planctomycetota bacterium]|nr:hypothetical protein [Planctomycetota bacterium]
MIAPIFGIVALAVLAYGAGRWVVPQREPGELRTGHAGLAILAGLCLLAALLSCAGALHAPRRAVTALAFATGASGLVVAARRRRASARNPERA